MNAHNNLENVFGDPKDYVGANLFGTSTDEGTPSWHFFTSAPTLQRHRAPHYSATKRIHFLLSTGIAGGVTDQLQAMLNEHLLNDQERLKNNWSFDCVLGKFTHTQIKNNKIKII